VHEYGPKKGHPGLFEWQGGLMLEAVRDELPNVCGCEQLGAADVMMVI